VGCRCAHELGIPHYCKAVNCYHLKLYFQLRLRCACAAIAMRERCDIIGTTQSTLCDNASINCPMARGAALIQLFRGFLLMLYSNIRSIRHRYGSSLLPKVVTPTTIFRTLPHWRRNVSPRDSLSRPTFKSETAYNALSHPTFLGNNTHRTSFQEAGLGELEGEPSHFSNHSGAYVLPTNRQTAAE
jgi:hypothetical protein